MQVPPLRRTSVSLVVRPGIAMACELAHSVLDICILESGGLRLESQTKSLSDGQTSGIPYIELNETRYRLLGGSTYRWGARGASCKRSTMRNDLGCPIAAGRYPGMNCSRIMNEFINSSAVIVRFNMMGQSGTRSTLTLHRLIQPVCAGPRFSSVKSFCLESITEKH